MRDFKKTLTEIAIFTAVPADLLAIVPAVYRFLIFAGLFSGDATTSLPSHVDIGVPLPIRDLTFVLLFYASCALIYYSISKIKENDDFNALRIFAITPLAFFGIPLTLALITFGMISLADGMSIAAILGVFSLITWRNFKDNYIYEYHDIGVFYLLVVPLAWLFLEIDSETGWLVNLGWAWIYTAIGYVISTVIVCITIIVYISATHNDFRIKPDEPSEFSALIVPAISFGILVLIGYISFVLSIDIAFLKITGLLLPIVCIALLIWQWKKK